MAPSASTFLTLLASVLIVASALEEDQGFKAAGSTEPKIWALLVAGSRGYWNYRHQADICHAYHVLRNHGIPKDRIVVMMYDDIANNSKNPTPGVILNHPNGNNVYRGVPKDYTGQLVTPQNFLDILQGMKVSGGSGKVIASGPNDHVFINFADHGAPGVLGFPHDELHARPLINVIKKMHNENKFAKMVLYIEACESGSMFDSLLPDNVNVYATTAADPYESSYACYFDDKRSTFLGDCYSVNWMEDSEREDLHKETLIDQFKLVRNETNTSHVMEYGDLNLGKLPVSEFQGGKPTEPNEYGPATRDAVSSRDVPLVILRKKLQRATDKATKLSVMRKLKRVIRNRWFLADKMREITSFASEGKPDRTASLLGTKLPLRNHDCYERAVQHFSENCFRISNNPYALEHLQVLVNMCESELDINRITEAMDLACIHPTVIDIV